MGTEAPPEIRVKHHLVAFHRTSTDEILLVLEGGQLMLPYGFLAPPEREIECITRIGCSAGASLIQNRPAGCMIQRHEVGGYLVQFVHTAVVVGYPASAQWYPLAYLPQGIAETDLPLIERTVAVSRGLAPPFHFEYWPIADEARREQHRQELAALESGELEEFLRMHPYEERKCRPLEFHQRRIRQILAGEVPLRM